MALEKPGKLREFFLVLCGHPDNSKSYERILRKFFGGVGLVHEPFY